MADRPAYLAEPGRFLRHKGNGTIYGYTAVMAGNPAVEEVTEEQAFPERFIPSFHKGETKVDILTDDAVVEAVTPKKRKGKKSAEASKGLPK